MPLNALSDQCYPVLIRGQILPFRSRRSRAITAISAIWGYPLPGSSQIGVHFRRVIPRHPRLA